MSMKAYFSNHIMKNPLGLEMIHDISKTLFTFNQAKHYSFSTMVKELRSGQSKRSKDSMHVHVKKKFQLSDYYSNSIVQESNALLTSQKELNKMYIGNKQEQIKSVKNKIKSTKSRLTQLRKIKKSIIQGQIQLPKNLTISQYNHLFAVHYKKRTDIFYHTYSFEHEYVDVQINQLSSKLGHLEFRQDRLEKQLVSLKTTIKNVVFGSKKLFKSQFTLNKYFTNHELWKKDWKASRYSKMTISGRKDAKDGNFVFHYNPESQVLTFKTVDNKVVQIPNIVFPYGQEEVNRAIYQQMNCKDKKKYGKPISWSLEDMGDYYIVKCLMDVPVNDTVNHSKSNGIIGIDCNLDHFAVSNINYKGQLLHSFVINFDIHHKTSNQITKIIEQEVVGLIDYAVKHNKPIAIEKLDTSKSKLSTPYGAKKANKLKSLFAYRKMITAIKNRAEKMGIEVYEVNPAYTSQIGKIKYMKQFGISIHQSASYVIARRAMGFKEKLPPVLHSLVPEKKLGLHHWAQWSAVSKTLSVIPTYWFVHFELSDLVKLFQQGKLTSFGYLDFLKLKGVS